MTATINAGELKHRITLQRPGGTRDEYGERITEWTTVVEDYPARVAPVSGREQFIAAQQQSSTTHTVRFRYCSALVALDGAWRVLFRNRALAIDDVQNVDEENRIFQLSCTEGLREE